MDTKTTNYKKWSFRFFIYIILLQCVAFYRTINFAAGIDDTADFELKTSILSLVNILLFIVGVIFTILSIVKKEKKDYKYFISIIGYPLLLIYIISGVIYFIWVGELFRDY